jgi:3-oxoacyl-[acyl-carrier protein] reductase
MSQAVVTGGARGIGREIASKLIESGHQVIIVDVDGEVERTAREIGATAVSADLTDRAGRDRVVVAVTNGARPLRVLVNNAGITRDALIGKMTETNFRSVLRVNLGATYELTTALAEHIVDNGAVVNLSSRAQLGNVGQFNYAVSKGGVIGCTRALALAYAPRIRVNAVAPGFIESEMTAAMPARAREHVLASIPLARAGQPSDIANTVKWLASTESAYVTGQVLYVCGGRSFG